MKALVAGFFIGGTVIARASFGICAFGCSFMTMSATVTVDSSGPDFNHTYSGIGRVVCYNEFMNPMPGIADNETWTINTSLGSTVAINTCSSCCMDQAGVWNGATGGTVDYPRNCYQQRASSSNPQYSNEVGSGESCDTPLVLDLDGKGVHTTSLFDNPIVFDYRGTSVPKISGWTAAHSEAAFLYYDAKGDHTVSDGRSLFGNAMRVTRDTYHGKGSRPIFSRDAVDGSSDVNHSSVIGRWPDECCARHGFEALAAYDTPENGGNRDGVISPADEVWKRLRLWIDRNHDAKMSPDEDYSPEDFDILQISLAYAESSPAHNFGADEAGNYHYLRSTFLRRVEGQVVSRNIEDILFRTSQ